MALLYGAEALKMQMADKNLPADTSPAPQFLAELEGEKRRKRYKKKKCRGKSRSRSRSPRRRSRSSHSSCSDKKECHWTCTSVEEKCDIIMAHGYKEIFASSTLNIPFGYTKLAQQALDTEFKLTVFPQFFAGTNYESNFWDDQDFNFRGMNNVHCEAGAWQDNLTIGHYGVTTLRPNKDIQKRTGATDGWLADLVSANWRFNFAQWDSSAADTTSDTDSENALREFLTVLMPWKVEINEIRLQGIRTIDIGGRRGVSATDTDSYDTGELGNTDDLNDPLPGKVKENFRSAVRTFEVWCNDGYDWLVQEEGQDAWKNARFVTTPGARADDPNAFKFVRKYSTGATKGDWSKIFAQALEPVKCLEVRIVFTQYIGNVLGTKLGITVNDDDGNICGRCGEPNVSVSTSSTNGSSCGK